MRFLLSYPCPEFDLNATQRWLERRAARGHILCPVQVLPGFAAFEKAEPQSIRYRLIPIGDAGIFPHADEQPGEDALELYRQMGWEYITNRGRFHIFASRDPGAPEPNTDPLVLSLALKPALFRAAADTVAWLLLALLWVFGMGIFHTAVSRNAPGWLLIPLPMVVLALVKLGSCVRLVHYRRACRAGQFPETRSRFFLPDNALVLMALVLVILGFVSAGDSPSIPRSEIFDDYVLYEDFDGTVPFPDAGELFPGSSVTDCTAVSFRTFATRENWYYDADFTLPNGQKGSLQVDYDAFPTPLLATWYAWELEHRAQPDELILRDGTKVYHIQSSIPIDDPEAIFLTGKE